VYGSPVQAAVSRPAPARAMIVVFIWLSIDPPLQG
jgi:hypothetical protein